MKPTRAVIPLAGLASRLYPATKVIPKALLPVLGRDGSLRPAVDWIVREVLESGVDEVVLIVSPRDGDLIRRYFDEPPKGVLSGASGQRILHAWSELKEVSKHLRYVYQLEPGGFGHAVLQAFEVVSSHPFCLTLRGPSLPLSIHRPLRAPSSRYWIRVWQRGTRHIQVQRIRAKSTRDSRGPFLPNQSKVFELSDMREKPTDLEVRSTLRIPGSEPPQYFCLFGIYLLPGHFMEYLDAASQQLKQEELDLSRALRSWIDEMAVSPMK